MSKNRILFLIKILVFFLAFYYIKINFGLEFLTYIFAFKEKASWPLLIAFLIAILIFILSAYKWYILLKSFSQKPSFIKVLQSCLTGIFVSNFMFGSLAGDLLRIKQQANFTKLGYKTSLIIGSIDRFYTLLFYFGTLLILMLLFSEVTIEIKLAVFLLVFAALAILIFIWDRIQNIKNEKYIIFFKLFKPTIVFRYGWITFISTVLMGIEFMVIANKFGCNILVERLPQVLFGLLTNFLPLSISGWGIRELTLVSLLTPKNICLADEILYSSITFGLISAIVALPGAWFYLMGIKSEL